MQIVLADRPIERYCLPVKNIEFVKRQGRWVRIAADKDTRKTHGEWQCPNKYVITGVHLAITEYNVCYSMPPPRRLKYIVVFCCPRKRANAKWAPRIGYHVSSLSVKRFCHVHVCLCNRPCRVRVTDTRDGENARIDSRLNDRNKFEKYINCIYRSTRLNEFQNDFENKLKAERVISNTLRFGDYWTGTGPEKHLIYTCKQKIIPRYNRRKRVARKLFFDSKSTICHCIPIWNLWSAVKLLFRRS